MDLSVIICTYNPNLIILNTVIDSLTNQTFPKNRWQLIIVDNKSDIPLAEMINLTWHPDHLILREEKIGLLNARITGIEHCKGNLIVFVDDDNQLDFNYLQKAVKFNMENPQVGSFGGRSLPVFKKPPPDWFFQTGISLGCQDHGEMNIISEFKRNNFKIKEYPDYAPIGTGMVITKKSILFYIADIQNHDERSKLGRSGKLLYSGEDNDMILTIIKYGFEIAYVPELVVYHIIPAKRLTLKYLSNMAYNSSISWIKLLNFHEICPWRNIPKWSVIFREAKAWVNYRAWQSPANYVKWRGACGMFKALSEIND
jgi:glycosyltransferase involved in cell wall biosynthesis